MDPCKRASETASTNDQSDDQTSQDKHATTFTTATTTTAATITTAMAVAGDDNVSQPLEDEQEVLKLYQTSPPHFWPIFNGILQFCDAVDQEDIDYITMDGVLKKVFNGYDTFSSEDATVIAQCAVAAGFVTQAAKVIHMAIGGGMLFAPGPNLKVSCCATLRALLINFTYFEKRICVRLVKTGILHNIVKCLKIFRRMPPKTEQEIVMRTDFIGILLNSCKVPEVAAQVKDMDVVPDIASFLDKKMNLDIRLASLFLLGCIVDDTQLGYLEMDYAMMDYSLCCIKQALEPVRKYCFRAGGTAVTLSYVARLQFNKRLIIAKEGAMEMLTTVLQKGKQEDIDGVLTLFVALATDPINASIFKRHRELVKVLTALRDKQECRCADDATKILARIKETTDEEDGIKENTSMADVLENRTNALLILNVGKVEFVLNRLCDLTSGRSVSCCQVTGVKLVKALRELGKIQSYSREIMARGGLSLLQKLLQREGDDDRLESIHLLLELASCKEYSLLIQADTELMKSIQELTRHDNQQVRQAASQLVFNINACLRRLPHNIEIV